MRLLLILLVPAVIYFVLFRNSPVGPVVQTVTGAPAAVASGTAGGATPGTDFLKRPLDRTQEVLKQARERVNDDALK